MNKSVFLLIVLFIIGRHCYGQSTCDTLSADITKIFDTYSSKQLDRLKRKKNLDAQTAFKIATYLRMKPESTNKDWYILSIKLFKNMYDGADKTSKPCPLFYIGEAYYYLDDYPSANAWFIKAIKAQCPDPCLNFYYNLTTQNANSDSINWQTIIQTSTFTVVNKVSEINPLILDRFPSWKSMSDNGGKFNATDNGGGPRKRLYFAAYYQDYWIVSYEHGGRGYHTDCVLIKINPHKTLAVTQTYKEFKTLTDLRAFMAQQILPTEKWEWSEK